MKTFRVLMALAVMVVIVGATEAAQATTKAGKRTADGGRAKAADKAPAETITQEKMGAETKRVKKQAQAEKPAEKGVAPKAKASRKKLSGDKPLETGKNGGSRTARKKSA